MKGCQKNNREIWVSTEASRGRRDRVQGYSKASVFSLLPVGVPALAKAVAAGSRAVSVPPPTDDGYTPTDQSRRKRQKDREVRRVSLSQFLQSLERKCDRRTPQKMNRCEIRLDQQNDRTIAIQQEPLIEL